MPFKDLIWRKRVNNYFQIVDKLLKNIDDITITEDLRQAFIERTKNHIRLVNDFARKIGKEYPNHDASKLNDLLEPYSLFLKKNKTQAEEELLDLATIIHIKNSPHHPEYWTDTNIEGFTRKNPNPHGIIDATDMPDEALEEMAADWCATGVMKNNSGMEWFNKVNGVRWLFTTEQQAYLRKLLNIMEK